MDFNDTFIKNYIKENKEKKSLYEICNTLIVKYFFLLEDIEYVYSFFFDEDININDIKLTSDKQKRLDSEFKNKVKQRYNKCIISGYNIRQCEVAHIIPFCKSNEIDKYNPNNGLLLSCELHKLFDEKVFKINPNTFEIEIDELIEDIKELAIYKYKNKKLDININSIPYLDKIY